MVKSADAFRTISEVADWLDTPAHVLRFWESKFAQVRPVKRAGGRRYYRPQDMRLLGGIKKLLYDDGMTIKGVQKLLRDSGVRHVAALSQALAGEDEAEIAADWRAGMAEPAGPGAPEPARVLDFRRRSADAPGDGASEEVAEPPAAPAPAEPEARFPEPAADAAQPNATPAAPRPGEHPAAKPTGLPAFLSRPLTTQPAEPPESTAPAPETALPPSEEPLPKPRAVEVPPDPDDATFAAPGVLSRLADLPRPLPAPMAAAARPVLDSLRALLRKSGDAG